MFVRRRYESNGAVKMAMIIPRKETQTIRLSYFKSFKSPRIGRMTLQSREEGFNKGIIRGGTGSCIGSQHMNGLQRLAQEPEREISETEPGPPEWEKEFIFHTLEKHAWNRQDAAHALQISLEELDFKIKAYGLKA